MDKFTFTFLMFAVLLFGQKGDVIRKPQIFSGGIDAAESPFTRPAAVRPDLPATCRFGEVVILSTATPGQNMRLCTSPGTWMMISGNSSGSSAPNIYSTTVGASTSMTLDITTLNLSDIGPALYQCWTATAPVAITGFSTTGTAPIAGLTLNYTSTIGVTCRVNSSGSVGPAGPQGSVGPAGPQGSVGPAGPQGSVGPAGAAGADGATGPAGPAGAGGVSYSGTLASWGTIGAGACGEKALTATGAVAGDVPALGPPTLPTGIVAMATAASNLITVRLCNITGSGIAVSDGSYSASVIRIP